MEKNANDDKNYTVMMVAAEDFYITNPSTQDNQIEYNDGLNDLTEQKQFDNPVYQKEEATDSTSSTKSTSSDSFYSSDYKYGWLCLQRNALQLFNRPLFFLVCIVASAVAQGLIVTGISFTILTSIEREFGFKSTVAGSFGTFYDAAYGVCCVFAGYIGHRHKPRWLGLGLILMAVAAVILSVPKYIIGTYTAGQKRDTDFCVVSSVNGTDTGENCTESSDWYYMFIFVFGNVLMGIGATPLYTLGPAHINEITDRGQGSLYLGIYYAGAAVGPALGFILGLPILNTWTDIKQGTVATGMHNTFLTSIERRYGFSSSKVGLFSTVFHLVGGSLAILVCYAGQRHKPLTISFGLACLVTGTSILTIPQYVSPSYHAQRLVARDMCNSMVNGTSQCQFLKMSSGTYLGIFLTGHALNGLGSLPLYSLGFAHIDEIAERRQNNMFFTAMGTCSILGPAVGFMMGGQVLNIYVDITQENDPPLTPSDTNWVGAWWIGYLVGAVFLLIPVIPMLGFPPLFPDTHAVRERKKEFEDTIEENKDLKHDLKSVWPATLALLKNPTYLFLCLAISSESLAIGGFSTFLPKFVETQFHFPASSSGLYTGLIVIPGAAGGIFLGGYLSMRFNWNCRQTLKAAAIMAFIATICVSTTLVGCDSMVVVGSNDDQYYNSSGNVQLITECNSMCGCDRGFYKPVCNEINGRTFFSPCHAGCLESNSIGNKFYNCSCAPPEVPYLVHGGCSPECTLFPLFVVGAFLMMFFTFMNNVPMINATFRVVPEGQGSFAMGFQQVFVRFLGFVPAPIMFGKLIDESCYLWGKDECTDETTSCLEYNNEKFRYYLFMLGVVTKALSFIFIFLAYKVYKLPTNSEKKTTASEATINHNEYTMKEIKAREHVITKSDMKEIKSSKIDKPTIVSCIV